LLKEPLSLIFGVSTYGPYVDLTDFILEKVPEIFDRVEVRRSGRPAESGNFLSFQIASNSDGGMD
jgi:hypothetical protein